MDQLADSLKNPTAILHIIKYEVLHKKPIFESYKTMCKLIGDDFMDYVEFEFWYMRFYNGKLEMDYDRSQEKEPLTLSELPVEIVSKVMEWLDPISRITTRQVSKILRSIIDNQPLFLKSLEFYPSDTVGLIQFGQNSRRIWYKKRDEDDWESNRHKRYFEFWGVNIAKLASIHFKILTTNSMLKVETYQISIETEYPHLEDFVPLCQISAKNLHIETWRRELYFFGMILHKCKPGTLENIHLKAKSRCQLNQILTITDEACEMDQWKQAKTMDMLNWGMIKPNELRHFYHFVEFSVQVIWMSQNDLKTLINNLLLRTSFQKCKIQIQKKQFGKNFIGDGLTDVEEVDEHTIHVPLPNSSDVLEVRVGDKEVTVEKKTI